MPQLDLPRSRLMWNDRASQTWVRNDSQSLNIDRAALRTYPPGQVPVGGFILNTYPFGLPRTQYILLYKSYTSNIKVMQIIQN
jgi:hypothetical protein